MKLEGKIAIVTGSRRGIGKAIALALAREGASVVVCDLDQEDCRKVVREIEAGGGRALAIKCDVSVRAEVQEMVSRTISEWGRVDILVNNAMTTVIKPFWKTTEQEWDNIMDVNLKGAFLCSQAVTRNMIKNGWGRIINIASISSGVSGATPLLAAYTASKGGMKALSQAMAVELAGFGINVNAICPGPIDSGVLPDSIKKRSIESVPKGKLGKPEEIASLAVYMASPESEYMTGSIVAMDGGASAL
jgi:3-oxoacyl-[acyl-carrier protein] reductase